MKTIITLLLLTSITAFAGDRTITFQPSRSWQNVMYQGCEIKQSGYTFDIAMGGWPRTCTAENLFDTPDNLASGSVGAFAGYGMLAPEGKLFNLKSFRLRGATEIVLTTMTPHDGRFTNYSRHLHVDSDGRFIVNEDGISEMYIMAETSEKLYLTSIEIYE